MNVIINVWLPLSVGNVLSSCMSDVHDSAVTWICSETGGSTERTNWAVGRRDANKTELGTHRSEGAGAFRAAHSIALLNI